MQITEMNVTPDITRRTQVETAKRTPRPLTVAHTPFVLLETPQATLLVRSEIEQRTAQDELMTRLLSPIPAHPCPVESYFGRGPVGTVELGGVLTVVRPLRRGGFLRFVNRDLFLRTPGRSVLELRPFRELVILSLLRGGGASVPEPVFALTKGGSFPCTYRGSVGTAAIEGGRSLLSLARSTTLPRAKLLHYAEEAGRAAHMIVKLAVLHPDLHPGNVLVARDGRVVVIDFDKAQFLPDRASEGQAFKQLSKRWQRFVEKYTLPMEISGAFRGALYGSYNRQ